MSVNTLDRGELRHPGVPHSQPAQAGLLKVQLHSKIVLLIARFLYRRSQVQKTIHTSQENATFSPLFTATLYRCESIPQDRCWL